MSIRRAAVSEHKHHSSLSSPLQGLAHGTLLFRPAVLKNMHVAIVQGAQLMSKYGINVPPGIPAKSLDEVAKAIDQMADEKGEVGPWGLKSRCGFSMPCSMGVAVGGWG